MEKSLLKRLITSTLILIFSVTMFTGCFLDTGAWFSDNNDHTNIDDVAEIEIALLDGNNALLVTNPVFTYTGAKTEPFSVKVSNSGLSSLPALVRVMINGVWSNGLQLRNNNENTITYNYNSAAFSERNVGDMGYNFVYFNTKLLVGASAVFLNSVTFPTLPEEYLGQTISFTISVEGVQANSGGVYLWQNVAPIGWNPLV